MPIETMSLVNIIGKLSDLDETLIRIANCELFHPENVTNKSKAEGFEHVNEQNPYVNLLQKTDDLLQKLNIPKKFNDYSYLKMSIEEIEAFINDIFYKVNNDSKEVSRLESVINLREKSLVEIKHMMKLNTKIDDILTSNYITARFGRLPIDSYIKLSYFKEKIFFFLPLDEDKDYCWGIYVTPNKHLSETDKYFNDMYFEEYCIPDYVHGTPQLAIENIKHKIKREKKSLQNIKSDLENYKQKYTYKLLLIYSKIKMLHDSFAYRRYAVIGNKKFYLNGFVPKENLNEFIEIFDDMSGVIIESLSADANKELTPPVKLKTCWLFRPFEMYVTTYGLPQYGDINPSSYIGLIYSILFGIMFGDVGQGICIFIVGLLIWKFKKMMLGLILTRCGVCSMIVGVMYGSFFGFENQFKEFWQMLGLGSLFPIDVLNPSSSMNMLIFSLGIGILLILISMLMNIFINIKNKHIGNAIFSNNGLAGLVMYGGLALAIVLLMALDVNIFNPVFLILVIIVPLILIFFSEPLSNLIQNHIKQRNAKKEKFSPVNAIFEMVDILLSYCTNTLSFLRVGGLVLSHAALMLVVMKFAHMAGSFGSPFVIVIGNVFVMGFEGLIVSIQVLRLVYYEMFSRFYKSEGKPFKPAKVVFESSKTKKK